MGHNDSALARNRSRLDSCELTGTHFSKAQKMFNTSINQAENTHLAHFTHSGIQNKNNSAP